MCRMIRKGVDVYEQVVLYASAQSPPPSSSRHINRGRHVPLSRLYPNKKASHHEPWLRNLPRRLPSAASMPTEKCGCPKSPENLS